MPSWEVRRTIRREYEAAYWLVTDVAALCDLTPDWDTLWNDTGRVVRRLALRHAEMQRA